MAKIESWEERIRGDMAEFAKQTNIAYSVAFAMHADALARDPEHVKVLNFDSPAFIDQMIKPAHDLFVVAEMARRVIELEEEEQDDLERRHKLMKPIVEFTDGMSVSLEWEFSQGEYKLGRVLAGSDEDHPLVTAYLVFCLDDYLNRYRGLVHLGSCRSCRRVYLKPKHGQKMRYCSPACRQRAYRKRREDGEAKET